MWFFATEVSMDLFLIDGIIQVVVPNGSAATPELGPVVNKPGAKEELSTTFYLIFSPSVRIAARVLPASASL